MLGATPILNPCNSHKLLPLPNTCHFSSLSLSSNSLHNGRSSSFCISAIKKQKSSKSVEVGEGEETMMLMMPFHEMRRWFQNKPPGFGEGKVYDTSIEDKLLEEIEQSRKAQLANLNNLNNTSPREGNANKQQELKTQKVYEAVQRGIQVRLGKLPKKKNIHRDLQIAFKDFPGIMHISPAVTGNNKTRDPICKGFAFLYLESEEAAQRFVEMYSEQNIPFGKIQKQIKCEIVDAQKLSESAVAQSTTSNSVTSPEQSTPEEKDIIDEESDLDSFEWDSEEEMLMEKSALSSDYSTEIMTELKYSTDEDLMSSHAQVIEMGLGDFSISEPDDRERMRKMNKDDAVPPKQQRKKQAVQKARRVKEKPDKDTKSHNLGSAIRLKVKEKAVLTGVLSKYGGIVSSKES